MVSLFSRPAIQPDENVFIYPSFAHWDESTQCWVASISACVWERSNSALRSSLLAKILRHLAAADFCVKSNAVCKERLRLLMADHERGKKIAVRIGGAELNVGITRANGHASAELPLPRESVGACVGPAAAHLHGWLRCHAVLPSLDERDFSGQIQCIAPKGVSVISDLDDTIKDSGVTNRPDMLRKTFFEPWRDVPGMAAVYQKWARHGATFHYVSASPWQLFPAVEDFRAEFGFPSGSWALRPVRLTDKTLLDLFASPERFKTAQIARLIYRFRHRRFVLVGDSGEKDPEIYASVARCFPDQVSRIFIRQVPKAERTDSNLQSVFAGLPAERWRAFETPKEIAEAIPDKSFH